MPCTHTLDIESSMLSYCPGSQAILLPQVQVEYMGNLVQVWSVGSGVSVPSWTRNLAGSPFHQSVNAREHIQNQMPEGRHYYHHYPMVSNSSNHFHSHSQRMKMSQPSPTHPHPEVSNLQVQHSSELLVLDWILCWMSSEISDPPNATRDPG